MWWLRKQFPWRRLIPALLPALLLAGCGYGFAGNSPSMLGSGGATLRLAGVEQPTVLPWVSNALRTALREEIAARNLAVWKDSGAADFSMHLRMEEFTMRGTVKDPADASLIYTGSVTLTAVLYSSADSAEIWRSTASYADTFESNNQEGAGALLFRQAVRMLAADLRKTF